MHAIATSYHLTDQPVVDFEADAAASALLPGRVDG